MRKIIAQMGKCFGWGPHQSVFIMSKQLCDTVLPQLSANPADWMFLLEFEKQYLQVLDANLPPSQGGIGYDDSHHLLS